MSGLTRREWQLASAVTRLVAAEGSVTEAVLTDRLSASHTEVRRVVGMLVGRGRLQRCDDYLVPASAAPGQAGGAA